jgi:SAM-dependent methyltransferase
MGNPRKATLRRFPFTLLVPGYPDEARRVIQEPVFAEAVAEHRPHGRCLNAGCGEGLFSAFLESFEGITEIVNVDITMPRISTHRGDTRHTDFVGSVTDLALEDGSIDWVLCTEVIEHIENDRDAVLELGRVLKPGGLALISVPTPPAPEDPNHAREGYTLQELRDLLAQGDLEVIWHQYCFHLPMRWLLPTWRWMYNRLGRGRRSVMPRLAVLMFAYADKWFRWGRPWDLVVLARRT